MGWAVVGGDAAVRSGGRQHISMQEPARGWPTLHDAALRLLYCAVLRCAGGTFQGRPTPWWGGQQGFAAPDRKGACSTTPPSCGSCAARWQVGPDPTAGASQKKV